MGLVNPNNQLSRHAAGYIVRAFGLQVLSVTCFQIPADISRFLDEMVLLLLPSIKKNNVL